MKRRMMQVHFGMVLLLAIGNASICYAHGADGWEPDSCTNHSCTAGPINAGTVSYAGTTLYRHHNAPYSKNSNSDIDCHQTGTTTYVDVAENVFTVDWKIQKYSGGTWIDVFQDAITGDTTGANWDTTEREPGYEYRAVAFTNDTSGDGPYGDDPGVYRYSAGQLLHAPAVTNYHVTVAEPGDDGAFVFEFEWDSTCGDDAHLDWVRMREYVTYEDNYTTNGTHDLGHNNSNCFTSDWGDPTYGTPDVLGSAGTWGDEHIRPTNAGLKESSCQASQKYQWATGYPNVPSVYDNDADWHTIETHTIKRYVEERPDDPTKWRFRFIKDDRDDWRSIYWY